ncbi:hypothetical protein MRX96_052883 [Rhipicephalus microplus]
MSIQNFLIDIGLYTVASAWELAARPIERMVLMPAPYINCSAKAHVAITLIALTMKQTGRSCANAIITIASACPSALPINGPMNSVDVTVLRKA